MTDKSPLKAALCEFKKNNIKIYKTANNPFFKSKYADLPTILDAIEEPLADLGLIIISTSQQAEDGSWKEVTILEHKDCDEVRMSAFPLFGSKPQEFGSSITYARRYNIQSLLNLAAADDDGNAANNAEPVKKVYPTAVKMKAAYQQVLDDLNASEDLADLSSAWILHKDELNKLQQCSEQFYISLTERKDELKVQFTAIDNEEGN